MFGVPFACSLGYLAVTVCLVLSAIPQLPAWAQGRVLDWTLGTPQETLDEPGKGLISHGTVPFDGYTGPVSFQCLLPPVRGYLTDAYGASRAEGWIHQGVDYGTYFESVDVRTPYGGKVVFAGWKGPYGNLVVVENAGFQVYLAHHSEIYVSLGQVVDAADVVGRSGSTGNSSGIHVHMEIRRWDGTRWSSHNPDLTLLPGQPAFCNWHSLSAP